MFISHSKTSRNAREGRYAGVVGTKHVRDIFKFKNGRVYSNGLPHTRQQFKALWVNPPVFLDIPF